MKERAREMYLVQREFIYADIQREINLARVALNPIMKFLLKLTIKHSDGANFMAALALLCYTEAAGKIINGGNSSANNFNTFFDLLGDEYKAFREKHVVYDVFRCGLAHEYYVKKSCSIAMLKGKASCGIGIDTSGSYYFVVEKYFDDFKRAFDSLLGISEMGGKNSNNSTLARASLLSVQKY